MSAAMGVAVSALVLRLQAPLHRLRVSMVHLWHSEPFGASGCFSDCGDVKVPNLLPPRHESPAPQPDSWGELAWFLASRQEGAVVEVGGTGWGQAGTGNR